MVRLGITGYTQAYFRNGLVAREKRLKDAWYANHVSFGLDVKIFLKSIITVLKRENVYTNEGNGPEDTEGKYGQIKRIYE
jgi:lipopolysaccharide/colanic/teichoic acid biosynthesis glycosyltransferase